MSKTKKALALAALLALSACTNRPIITYKGHYEYCRGQGQPPEVCLEYARQRCDFAVCKWGS